jgi:glucan phosphoethanolaminetransferase (alkaline phosphatase superfamily)
MAQAVQRAPALARRVRRFVLAASILAIAVVLALPAVLYAIRLPTQTNVLSAFLAAGFFAAVFTLVRRVWLQLLIGLPVMLLNVIEIVHILIYGQLISLGGVEAILHVDPHEAREFVSDNKPVFLLGIGVVGAFCALAWLRRRLDDLSPGQRLAFGTASFGLPVAVLAADLTLFGSQHEVYLPTRVLEHYVAHLGGNPLTQTVSGLASTIAARAELQKAREVRDAFRFGARSVSALPERQLHILVLGESSRRRNWAIYGYGRPTSPQLQREPNAVAFSDAVSAANLTHRSIAISLSMITPETIDRFHRTRSIVSAFRESGFRTFWLSNQGAHRSAVGNEIALIMGEAEVVQTTNFGFWNSVLDEKLLPALDEALRDPAPRKLIIIHTLGSHTNYRQRVPAEWSLGAGAQPVQTAHGYPAISEAQASIVSDYDRTISYTDWFVHQVIERHRATSMDGSVTYVSDHGQRLFDDRDGHKGHGFRDLRPQDVEVPLVVWLSDALVRRDPGRLAAARANAARPVSTGTLGQSLLDLAGIDIGRPLAAESFLSPGFSPNPRTVILPDGRTVAYAPAADVPVAGAPAPPVLRDAAASARALPAAPDRGARPIE